MTFNFTSKPKNLFLLPSTYKISQGTLYSSQAPLLFHTRSFTPSNNFPPTTDLWIFIFSSTWWPSSSLNSSKWLPKHSRNHWYFLQHLQSQTHCENTVITLQDYILACMFFNSFPKWISYSFKNLFELGFLEKVANSKSGQEISRWFWDILVWPQARNQRLIWGHGKKTQVPT